MFYRMEYEIILVIKLHRNYLRISAIIKNWSKKNWYRYSVME